MYKCSTVMCPVPLAISFMRLSLMKTFSSAAMEFHRALTTSSRILRPKCLTTGLGLLATKWNPHCDP